MNTCGAHRNVVLIGFMGSGKSSVGRLVAARLGFQFVDTDARIVADVGLSIPQIFEQHGEPFFREGETRVLQALASLTAAVVATGGGIVTRPENLPLLRELGFVVALTAAADIIFSRVSRSNKRPLLQTENPQETIRTLLAARAPLYQAAAHRVIDTSSSSHAEIADEIIEAWEGSSLPA